MAQTNINAPRKRSGWKIGLILVLAALIAAVIYFLPAMKGYSATGSAYAARVVCSCRYIGGREMGDCEKDLEDGMELVSLSEDTDAKRVSASMPIFDGAAAEYREGYGCVMLTEAEREAL